MSWDPEQVAARKSPAPRRSYSTVAEQSIPFFSGDPLSAATPAVMSTSASTSYCRWPRYGPVPLGRCPDCPRTAPLKRLTTVTDENGNAGREFVKCESKPELGKPDLRKCHHFEWIDEYINRIEVEGAFLGVDSPPPAVQLGSATVVAPAGKADRVAAEVKEMMKMNKHLKKLVDLKKLDNLMSAIFYLCAIALGVVYLLIISQ